MTMSEPRSNQEIQDQILEAALEDVPFDGWTWPVVKDAAAKAGYEPAMADAVFPEKMESVLTHFSDWADRQMMDKLNALNPDDFKIRERIEEGVKARLQVLAPHKEAVKAAAAYWARPWRKHKAARNIWTTCDHIWNWAGDTATDYNRYTKRILLAGVMTSTMITWFQDKSEGAEKTHQFLKDRIGNVLTIGKTLGRFKPKFPFGSKAV